MSHRASLARASITGDSVDVYEGTNFCCTSQNDELTSFPWNILDSFVEESLQG